MFTCLVAMAFLGHKPRRVWALVVDHYPDRSKTNNNIIENLRIDYVKEKDTSRAYKRGSSKYTGVSWHIHNHGKVVF